MLESHITFVWDYCHAIGDRYSPDGCLRLRESVFAKHQVKKNENLMAYLVGEALASLQFKNMPDHIFSSTCALAEILQKGRAKNHRNTLRFERWLERPFKLIKSKFVERHLFDPEYRPWRTTLSNISILLEQTKDVRKAFPRTTLINYQESLFGEYFGKPLIIGILMNHFTSLCRHIPFDSVMVKSQAQHVMALLFTDRHVRQRFGITSLFNIPLHLFLNRESNYLFSIIKRTAKYNFENESYELFSSILENNKDGTLGTLFINEMLLHYYLSKHERTNQAFSQKIKDIEPAFLTKENRGFARHFLKHYAFSISDLRLHFTQAINDLWRISGNALPSLKQAQDGIFGATTKIPMTYRPLKRFQYAECDSPFVTTKITHSFADGLAYLANKRDSMLFNQLPYSLILLAIKAGLTHPYDVLCSHELTQEQTEELTEMMIN